MVEHHDGRRPRPVRVHVPDGLDPATAAPLVVALHGCTQTAATFAAGALLDQEADRHGFVVAYPEQVREDNPQGCWNWFTAEHQSRGAGEPAFLAGATRAVMAEASRWTIDPRRVFVVGMSAGGAMASVLAATHPDVFSAVAVHSGLAYGCRPHPPVGDAGDARRGGPDPEGQGRAAFAAMGARRAASFPPSSSTAPPTRSCARSTGSTRSGSGWRRTGSPAATPPMSRARTRSSATTPPGGCR